MAGNDIDIDLRGPLFAGRSPAAVRRFARDATDAIAAQTYSEVMGNLNGSIRHPTPYYETQIVNQRMGEGRKVHDRGIVYGPWLEGTSARNQTTTFRGYHSFGRAREVMRARAAQIARWVLRRHIGQM